MKLNYKQNGDYLIPELELKNKNNKNLNKYALLKLDYIKNHKKALYTTLLMKEELNNYLFSVGVEAENKVNILMKNQIKNDKELTENMKEKNQLLWVQKMNNYKNIAEEIVLKELIYN